VYVRTTDRAVPDRKVNSTNDTDSGTLLFIKNAFEIELILVIASFHHSLFNQVYVSLGIIFGDMYHWKNLASSTASTAACAKPVARKNRQIADNRGLLILIYQFPLQALPVIDSHYRSNNGLCDILNEIHIAPPVLR
jgi:hypothetical protein